ncbi:MAG: OB-fold domain-containing protein [Rhizobiaceae bacterium]|nr:OB-fold domain-containing protein [Rhizobiaceae bacterium]
MAIGITRFGAYIPRLRLPRAAIAEANAWYNPGLKGMAKGERCFANWDEDAITMAVEAARDTLGESSRDDVGQLVMASTTFPFADRQNSVVVKEALNLPDAVAAMDVAGSQRAGTSALRAACLGSGGPTLVVAAEKRAAKVAGEAEMTTGHAAAAFLIGEDPVAEFLGAHSTAVDMVDHYRSSGEDYDYNWESRWVREIGFGEIVPNAVKEALSRLSLKASEIAHLVVAGPSGIGARVAAQSGISATAVADTLAATMGDSGTAHPLLLLADVLERARPGEIIVVVGFGQGCDVLAFRATDRIGSVRPLLGVRGWLARRAEMRNYARYLALTGALDIERGIRAELDQQTAATVLYRNRKAVLGLIGGRCTKTGTVQFPMTRVSVARNAHEIDTQEPYPLADLPGKVLTFTADRLAYNPNPPLYFGTVQFDGGGRLTADFTDVDEGAVDVGMRTRMMFRIRAVDEVRGFTKYFWKAAPAFNAKVA